MKKNLLYLVAGLLLGISMQFFYHQFWTPAETLENLETPLGMEEGMTNTPLIGVSMATEADRNDTETLQNVTFYGENTNLVVASLLLDDQQRIKDAKIQIYRWINYRDIDGKLSSEEIRALKQQEVMAQAEREIERGFVNPCGVNWYTAGYDQQLRQLGVNLHLATALEAFQQCLVGKTLKELEKIFHGDARCAAVLDSLADQSFQKEVYMQAVINAFQQGETL